MCAFVGDTFAVSQKVKLSFDKTCVVDFYVAANP